MTADYQNRSRRKKTTKRSLLMLKMLTSTRCRKTTISHRESKRLQIFHKTV